MNEFEIDWAREERTGIAEAVYCEDKTVEQITSILSSADDRPLLLTRFGVEKFAKLSNELRAMLDHDASSRTAFYRCQ